MKGALEIQRGVVDDLLHDEEGAGLADAREGNQLIAVQLVEVADVADPDLQKEVEIPGDQMAIEHEPQFPDREFESPEALRRRAVEHHTDNHQRAAIEFLWRQFGPDTADVAILNKPLRAAVAGGRADVNGRGEIGVGHAAITLQQLQDLAIDAVDTAVG